MLLMLVARGDILRSDATLLWRKVDAFLESGSPFSVDTDARRRQTRERGARQKDDCASFCLRSHSRATQFIIRETNLAI